MARALAVSGKGEPAVVQDVSVGEPGPGQVRVRVGAASVNGIDAYAAAGYLWDAMPHDFPVVIGRDFAGVVDAVGEQVDDLSAGQRVAGVITALRLGSGGVGTEVTADVAGIALLPESVTDVQGAAIGLAGVTALGLVDALALQPDDVVLVVGATGGVGSLAVQLAAATGATVLATARPGDEEFVRGLGAAHAVDYTADLATAVRAVAPEGVTAVIHAAGEPSAFGSVLRKGARVATALGATPEQVGRDDVTVTPVSGTATPARLGSLLDQVASGDLTVPVDRTFALDDAASALEAFGGHKKGKLVVTLG